MSAIDFLNTISKIFTEIQAWTGFSAPALLLLLLGIYKAFGSAAKSESIAEAIATLVFYILFFWLVGFLVVNPI